MFDSPSYRVRTLARPTSVSITRGSKQQKPTSPYIARDVEPQLNSSKNAKSVGNLITISKQPMIITKPGLGTSLAQKIPKGFVIGSPSVCRVRRHASQRINTNIGGLIPPTKAAPIKPDIEADVIMEVQQSNPLKHILEKEEVETQISESRDKNTDSESQHDMKTILNSELAVGQVFDTELFKQNYLKLGSSRRQLTSCLKKRTVKTGILGKYLSEADVRPFNSTRSGFSANVPDRSLRHDHISQSLTQSDQPQYKAFGQTKNTTIGYGQHSSNKRVTFSENVIFFLFEQEEAQ